MAVATLAPDVQDAWRSSFLADLSDDATEALLVGASILEVPANTVFHTDYRDLESCRLLLMVEGLVSTVLRWDNERQATLRYARPGSVIGLPSTLLHCGGYRGELAHEHWRSLGGPHAAVVAYRDTQMLKLRGDVFMSLAEQDGAIALAAGYELLLFFSEAQRQLAEALFLPVRARVARHLLDLAVREGSTLTVHASQTQIANAVGSVREVISRTLLRLERAGLIARSGRTALHILEPALLHREASTWLE
jgi:CRP-like cAMP-binding protein